MFNKEIGYLAAAIICLVTGLLYLPSVQFDYVWDDFIWLNNLKKQGGAIFSTAFLEPFLIGKVYWRPLAELTLYFQNGDKPQILQHSVNVLIHLINICLLIIVVNRALVKGRLQASKWTYFLVLFFALHPAFVEPVAWVSGRFDLLLATTFLLSAICFLSVESQTKKLVGLGVIYAIALLIKETAILFIPIYVGVLWLMGGGSDIRKLVINERRLLALLIVITLVWLGLRWQVLGRTGGEFLISNTGAIFTFLKLRMILSTIGAYALLVLFPFKSLSTIYPVDQMLANVWYAIGGGVYLVAMTWLLYHGGNGGKVGGVMAIFLVSLLLVLNIIQVGFPDNLIQNRYLYLSLCVVIVCLLVSDFRLQFSVWGNYTFTLLAVVWIALSVLNINITLPLWKNTDKLSQWIYLENPDSPYSANMRASWLLDHGYIETGIEVAGKVAVDKPTHAAYKIIGEGYFIMGQCDQAYTYYRYAWDMGAFPIQEAEGLLGMYKLRFHQDSDEAEEIKEKIVKTLEDDPDELHYALERIAKYEKMDVVCLDSEKSE